MNIDKAKEDYLNGMKYKDLAEKYDVSINTVKSWVNRNGWAKFKKGCTQNKKGAHKDKVQENTVKTGDRSGNPNPENKFTKRNRVAETHGFFSKYLPEETLELTQQIQEKPYIDILWENITIQYAAIIRAQRIMYVKDQEDSTQLIKKQKIHESEMSSSSETEYEHHMSWDKQATFLQAQSRAMSELRSMIKQYDDLVNNGLATEEQRLRIEKLKQDINNSKGIDEADNQGVQDFIKATTMSEEEIKELFEDEDDEDGEEEEETD